ncbi:MAG: 2-oxoacid:acceptor oxidoreductase subunit alpha [bacterium]
MASGAFNIVLGGEAGQGLVTIGYLLSKSLVRSGYRLVVTQSYYSRIRGGHNTFAIRVSTDEVTSPCESIDLLVALDKETLVEDRPALSPEGFLVVDGAVETTDNQCLKIPYEELAKAKISNTVALGVAGYVLGVKEDLLAELMAAQFKKKPGVIDENQEALANTYRWCSEQPSFPHEKLAEVSEPSKRLMMDGNEALALGAVSAGVKFCSYYPMTPSTSIVVNLIGHAKKMGLIVEQVEDEIAAINMAIGASFAGAPSMVATSGGGFALMVEAVSLAGVSETPVVVFLAQRPGPATGLPTRTEQGDLEMVLHAGHGDFPRPILTPGTVEECFHLARKAFELAEKYHGPVFLLTDQFLADSYRAVDPFDIEQLPPISRNVVTELSQTPYRRYAITESGISPRLLPGFTEHLVVGDSHEHTETGHITEDPVIRKNMVDKRLRKELGMRDEVVPPIFEGDEKPDLLLVSWGSTKGAVSEAASRIRSKNTRVATLHFSQVWPLVPDQFVHYLNEAKQVVCVEGNATGQFERLIRRETSFYIEKQVLRYDGRPFTPEFIIRELGLESKK